MALRDPRQTQRLHQLVDAPGRDTANPSLLDHRDESLLGGLARLQERREVRALAQLGDAQLERAKTRVEAALAVTVAVIETFCRALVPAGPDQPLDIGFHQDLQYRLRNGSQEITIAALLQQLDKRHSVVGHRVPRVGCRRFSQFHLSSPSQWTTVAHARAGHWVQIDAPEQAARLMLKDAQRAPRGGLTKSPAATTCSTQLGISLDRKMDRLLAALAALPAAVASHDLSDDEIGAPIASVALVGTPPPATVADRNALRRAPCDGHWWPSCRTRPDIPPLPVNQHSHPTLPQPSPRIVASTIPNCPPVRAISAAIWDRWANAILTPSIATSLIL